MNRISSLLDNSDKIKAIDKGKMFEIQEKFPENCEDAVRRAEKLVIPKKVMVSEKISIVYRRPEKIIVAGMGGSAIGGNILKDWLRETTPIPIEVCRDYHLPAYADEKTLVLVSSYSGNTEETISALLEAVEKRCMIIAVSSNGVVQEFSQKMGLPFIKLPAGYPPRTAIPYLFFPLAVSLKKMEVLKEFDEDVKETFTILGQIREEVKIETPTSKNPAKRLAIDVEDSIPAIYGFGIYEGAALRIKSQFNENAKSPGIVASFPELNHNETVGWTEREDLTKKISVILIRDKDEPAEIKTRIEVTRRLVFDGKARKVVEIQSRGKSKLAKIFSTIYIGDYASIYLAILYNTDPTPVKIIDELKAQLEKRVDKAKTLRRQFEAITAS